MANINYNNWSAINLGSFAVLDYESSMDSIVANLDDLVLYEPDFTAQTSRLLQGTWGSWEFIFRGTAFGSDAARVTSMTLISGTDSIIFNGKVGVNGGAITSVSIVSDTTHVNFAGSLRFNSDLDFVGGTVKSVNLSQNGYFVSFGGSLTMSDTFEITGGTITSFSFEDPSGHKLSVSGISMDALVFDALADINLHTDLSALFSALNLSGNDVITAGVGNDSLSGGNGNDTINGGADDDSLNGDAGIDKLMGGDGNDTLDGGIGKDTMIGGNGADLYIVDNTLDVTTETNAVQLTGGIDEVQSSVTRTLGFNLENLTLTGSANINGTGNTLANTIIGNDGNNILSGSTGDDTLNGGLGNDTLDGGAGVDSLIGGDGDDTYTVDIIKVGTVAVLQDTITENASEGTDTINLRGSITTLATATTLVLAADLENLNASATTTTKLNLTGNELNNILTGNAAANILIGDVGNDSLIGGSGNDTLNGGDDNDTLDGGLGNDIMQGGAGNDYYVVNAAGDVIAEESNLDTSDTVQAAFSIDLNLLQYADIENIFLTGTAALSATGDGEFNIITGNAGANLIDGGAGVDIMMGSKGNDTYVVDDEDDIIIELLNEGIDTIKSSITFGLYTANVENLTLTGTSNINASGNELNNVITGNSGNNALSGGGDGSDTLIGGAGDDEYQIVYLYGNGPAPIYFDIAIEGLNAGIDTVILSAAGNNGLTKNYILSANIENLIDWGTYSIFAQFTGNELANNITGGHNPHIFDGKGGVDTLAGGFYDDTYIVDLITSKNGGIISAAPQDVIIESVGYGNDTLQLRGAIALTDYTTISLAGTNLENLDIGATGKTKLDITGNDFNNKLTGNAINNLLIGGLGNDTLDGGLGNDIMNGGDGNDSYYLNVAADVIQETTGVDTINVAFTADLNNVIFAGLIENITLTGASAINATGSAIGNVISGNTGKNLLQGLAGNDTLNGGLGNDTLDGGEGADSMEGGGGSDTYIVNNANDIVIETDSILATGGIDTVESSIDYTLFWNGTTYTTNIENLTLTDGSLSGAALNLNGIGNDFSNVIKGNTGANLLQGLEGSDLLIGGLGNDTLIGGGGNDTLNGGAGEDQFVFNDPSNSLTFWLEIDVAKTRDIIQNFITAEDKILLDNGKFLGLGNTIEATEFRVGTAALDSDDHLIYNSTTGRLYYDEDGVGGHAAVQFATLVSTVGTLTVDNFMLY